MSLLPFSSGFHYLSVFFVADDLIYITIIIIGFACMFHVDKDNQLLAVKYYICNYPTIYSICFIIIKPASLLYIGILYFINSGSVEYKNYLIKTYVDSDFIYYSEIITNTILYALVFFIIYRRYRKFKLAQTTT